MGASLLAKAVCQSTNVLNVMPSSRAGSLPHWFGVVVKICVHPLPTHAATSFESSIRLPGPPCINGFTGMTRHKKRIDPCGINPRSPTCALASK
ncbi:hypothetical protein EMIT0P253_20003 [Pseudomonas sp. IT-P253]